MGGLNLFQFLPCNFIAAKLKPTLSIAYAYTVGVCEIGQGFPLWFNLQMALFLLKGSMDMFETGSENEVLHSCDDVRKSHMMTSLLLYNTSIDASLVSGFVFHVISDWKKMHQWNTFIQNLMYWKMIFFAILGTKFIVFKLPRTDRPLPENVDLSSPFVTFHMMTSPDVSPAANVNV